MRRYDKVATVFYLCGSVMFLFGDATMGSVMFLLGSTLMLCCTDNSRE